MTDTDKRPYLIRKRGLYYRPNSQGYTASLADAGRYTHAEALAIIQPNGPNGIRYGMTMALAPESGEHTPHTPIKVRYRNYRGETAVREVAPIAVRYGTTEWHPEPGWLLRCWDVCKGAEREYALADCDFAMRGSDAERIAALESRLAIARRALLDVSNELQALAVVARMDGERIPHLAVRAASLALRDAHKASGDAEAVRAALREMQAIGEEMDEEARDA